MVSLGVESLLLLFKGSVSLLFSGGLQAIITSNRNKNNLFIICIQL